MKRVREGTVLRGVLSLLFVAALLTGCTQWEYEDSGANGTGGTDDAIIMKPVGNELEFETTEITAKAGSTLKVILRNTATSPAMRHSWALLTLDADIDDVALAANRAGSKNDYIPDHEGIIAAIPSTKPGEENEVEFTVPMEPGDYIYICLDPGQYVLMQGILHVTP